MIYEPPKSSMVRLHSMRCACGEDVPLNYHWRVDFSPLEFTCPDCGHRTTLRAEQGRAPGVLTRFGPKETP